MLLDVLIDIAKLAILTDHEWLRQGYGQNVEKRYKNKAYLFYAHACSIEPQNIRMRKICPGDVSMVRRE